MPAHHLEIERKYEVFAENGFQPDFSSLTDFKVGEPVTHELDAVYYDTVDRDLARARVAVRRRLGGHDEGWHIKFDDGLNGRHEMSFDLLKDRNRIPAAVTKFLRGVTADQTLMPVVSLETTRVRRVITDVAGQQVAEVCDDTVCARDYRTDIVREWREWEVELIDPGHELAQLGFEQIEKILIEAGATVSGSVAKIARAMGRDAEFEARRSGGAIEVSEYQTVKVEPVNPASLVRGVLENLQNRMAISDLKTRADLDGAIQELRTTVRKLAGFIQLAVLPFVKDEQSGIELNEIITELSEFAADTVSLKELASVKRFLETGNSYGVVSQAAETEILSYLATDWAEGYKSIRRTLESDEYIELLLFVRSLVAHMHTHIEFPRPEKFARKVAKAGKKLLASYLQDASDLWAIERDDFINVAGCESVLRMLAIDAKSVFYALDACAQAGIELTAGAQELAVKSDALQEKLSEQREIQEAHVWLQAATGRLASQGKDRLGLGYLLGIAEQKRHSQARREHDFVPKALAEIESLSVKKSLL